MRSENPSVQVLTTGLLALPELRKSLLKEGAVDYLIKPSYLDGFEHVRRLLEESFPELTRCNSGAESSHAPSDNLKAQRHNRTVRKRRQQATTRQPLA